MISTKYPVGGAEINQPAGESKKEVVLGVWSSLMDVSIYNVL